MSTEKTDALVVRLADWSESSRVVTLFTRDFGKVSAIAKGAKRLRSNFEAALDLLTHCRIVFIRKSSDGLDILTEAQLIRRFASGSKQIERLYAGYYLAELLERLTEEYDPHPELYAAALTALERFETTTQLELAVLRWELILLEEIGQLPMLTGCASCGQPVAPGIWFDFSVGQGGLICPTCHPQADFARPLQPGTLAALQLLTGESDTAWTRLALTSSQHSELRRMISPTIAHILGRRPKMYAYLKFLHPE